MYSVLFVVYLSMNLLTYLSMNLLAYLSMNSLFKQTPHKNYF